MINARDIRLRYPQGGFELRVPEVTIARGEQVALIGPSGVGKTSLLHVLCGILKPRSGSVEFDGQELTAMGDAARRALRIQRIGLVFQEFELLDYLTVRENILLPYRLSDALKITDEVRGNLTILAESASIADKLDRYPGTLSHGEKQRVAICRALITGPQFVAADEPTGSLDPRTAGNVLDLLLTTTFNAGATLLVVTHNHQVLGAFNRVIDMAKLYMGASS
jgi:putative ABC transport system ATP-binding protein